MKVTRKKFFRSTFYSPYVTFKKNKIHCITIWIWRMWDRIPTPSYKDTKIQKKKLLHSNMNLENLRQNTNANLNARLRTWTPNIERGTITQHQLLVRGNLSNVSSNWLILVRGFQTLIQRIISCKIYHYFMKMVYPHLPLHPNFMNCAYDLPRLIRLVLIYLFK